MMWCTLSTVAVSWFDLLPNSLHNNNIDDDGAKALAQALQTNSMLTNIE